ncbi:MAG: hypothetical protein U5L96_11020 [Owenweeksia sp.]|nr:hypothetical protein [Owenweeksia sp.]
MKTWPTGNYILCLDVLNKLGDTLASRNKFFYRQNQAAPIANQDLSQEELLNSFVGSLGGLDSIYQFIKYLYPISTDAQRKYQQELLAQKELADMKSYFYAFWKKQNPPNPALGLGELLP